MRKDDSKTAKLLNRPPKYLLPIIVFAQFAGTSLWFAGNAIIGEIEKVTQISSSSANVTSFVQFGFIAGTLVFPLFTIADRFSASKVFFFSALIAAVANLLLVWFAHDSTLLFTLRFVTGFFLAGIYPVGMKISADHFPKQLGNALGFLVGALVLGTAFPNLLKSQLQNFEWKQVLIFTSALAAFGGICILLFVPSANNRTASSRINLSTAFAVFRSSNFRRAAFGYFGHMWELYTLWAFVPIILSDYSRHNDDRINVPLWSFIVIATGCLGCIAGGLISKRAGSKQVAFIALVISGLCCLLSPLAFACQPLLFLFFLTIWGISVVTDSPQFSTLVAQSAPAENKGTALTIVTSIGFAITIVSVQVIRFFYPAMREATLLILVAGPALGLLSLAKYRTKRST